ncbi:heavy-metal-associated domain-containing protein [Mangrovimonas spongiae]|uniref:Copper chaperone n=1 Tax=Mangrovimonas spongiae TaxID=2494697 RepID=A0A428K1T8_9FLAO|nr:heavy-metal-associated domain-containing protein [Mangrovimonas spongiae]RSK40367.1 copper chaperone [Mangrovimonas spongiae]
MKTTIIVQNLKCGGCANTITNKLSEVNTISNLSISIEESKVTFTHNKETDVMLVKQALRNLGYPSIDAANPLTAKAKSFVSCATGKLSK